MSDRKVLVRYSDDGGRNWSNWREKSLGEVGEYKKRVRLWQMGKFVNRVWEIRVSSPTKRDMLGAVAYMEPTQG